MNESSWPRVKICRQIPTKSAGRLLSSTKSPLVVAKIGKIGKHCCLSEPLKARQESAHIQLQLPEGPKAALGPQSLGLKWLIESHVSFTWRRSSTIKKKNHLNITSHSATFWGPTRRQRSFNANRRCAPP